MRKFLIKEMCGEFAGEFWLGLGLGTTPDISKAYAYDADSLQVMSCDGIRREAIPIGSDAEKVARLERELAESQSSAEAWREARFSLANQVDVLKDALTRLTVDVRRAECLSDGWGDLKRQNADLQAANNALLQRARDAEGGEQDARNRLAEAGARVGLSLDSYQSCAATTAIYPGRGTFQGLTYCALKLSGEAGEVAEKVGKAIRDDGGVVSPDRRASLAKELGDVLWYVAGSAGELGYSLSEIALANLDKLASRKSRGVLGGSGDDR